MLRGSNPATLSRETTEMKLVTISALLSIGVLALASSTTDGVTLKKVLKEGEKDAYTQTTNLKFTMDMEAMGMGTQDMTIDMTNSATYSIGKVDAGKAALEILISDFDMKFGGGIGAQAGQMMGDLPKSYTIKGMVNERNMFSDVKLEGLSKQAQMMMGGESVAAMMNFVAFPEGEVKVGDSWEVTLPKLQAFGDKIVAVKYVYTGDKDQDGKACAEVSMDVTLPSNMVMSGEETGGMQMKITGNTVVKGTILVEKSSGRVLEAKQTGVIDQKMEMVDMGATLPMKGTMSNTVKLKG